jgi:hypothetical protein
MEEEDWSDFDEEQKPATAMEAHQQASQSAAESSPQHTPPPETMEDIEMEIDTCAAIELRPNKEGFLRMEVENPPEDYSTAYPVNLETYKTHFLSWYRHRENEKDNMPTSKNKQNQAIYYATVCLALDFEKFFHDQMNLSYFDILYELTFGMCINKDWRTKEERLEKKPVLFIPFVQTPQFYQDERQKKTRTAWYWSDENLSYIPRESLLALGVLNIPFGHPFSREILSHAKLTTSNQNAPILSTPLVDFLFVGN